ncbi:hypothetical protein I0C86_40570 [Plantactinospora sp. S1510]|uniref:Uncharacterized protein n=1 Tax=Plantactinospora alkalitolerans TaxID=2789879 RepID=A0ABS0H9M9_9ACTN|nr:hypothetical protein [Plantactinospora alkalitolerans]MBF9135176.1 hypothetical protein [Plantactinospora alkalitolerans]
MTAQTIQPALIGRSRAGRKIKPGWWVLTGGTFNIDTAEVDHRQEWLKVDNITVTDEVDGRHRYRRYLLHLADGSKLPTTATEFIRTLNPREAVAAGAASFGSAVPLPVDGSIAAPPNSTKGTR